MAKMQEKLRKIENKTKDVVSSEGIEAKYTSTLFKLWHDYIYSLDSGKLAGSETGWSAALYYILFNYIMKKQKSQAACASTFGISRSTLGKRYRKIRKTINLNDYRLDWKKEDQKTTKTGERSQIKNKKSKERIYKEARKKATKVKRGITTLPLSDELLIDIFRKTKELIEVLYKDKGYIEIKRYLKYVELNLLMTGYEVDEELLEKKFGQLFSYLKMIPKKGRQPEKFVHLQDRYGKKEPYVLIKLGG